MRDALRRFRVEQISIHAATAELGLGRSRFCELYGSYLAACARRRARSWTPIFSRGNQRQPFPDPVAATLRKLLGSVPPCPTPPLVALRLEPVLPSQSRPGSTHLHRPSTLSYPAPLRHLGHPQSPSKRRCLCPPTPPLPLQTPAPPPPGKPP